MKDMVTVRRDYISQNVRDYIFIRDGRCCRYCGQRKGNFHLDHVYPVSKGGETSIDNLVTSCQSCNSAKHNKIGMWPKPVGYFEQRKFRHFWIFWSHTILGVLVSVLTVLAIIETSDTWKTFEIIIVGIGWIPLLKGLMEIVLEPFQNSLKLWRE